MILLKVMFIDVKPLAETWNMSGSPLPAVGDDVVIRDTYYVVVSRVWTVEPYTVAIYVRVR